MGGTRFGDATAVHRRPDGAYDAAIDAGWGVVGNANGGYLLAILARAALAETGRAHPYSVAASFLAPGRDGPARAEVTTVRAGRTATYVRAVLLQGAGPVIEAQLVLGDPPGAPTPGEAASPTRPLTLPPPAAECIPWSGPPGKPILNDHVRVAYPAGDAPADPGPPTLRAWVGLREPEEPAALHALLALDSLHPTVWRIDRRGWAPTVSLTAWLYGVPAAPAMAAESRLGELRGGWFDEESLVADPDGRLVARARQLARLPR